MASSLKGKLLTLHSHYFFKLIHTNVLLFRKLNQNSQNKLKTSTSISALDSRQILQVIPARRAHRVQMKTVTAQARTPIVDKKA